MKHILILLLAIAITFPSCKKSNKDSTNYMSTGHIEGPNLSMTVCGGGYLIVIDSDFPAVQTFIDSLPAGSGIDLATATFPIAVKFNWHKRANPNPCNYIVIDAIAKTN